MHTSNLNFIFIDVLQELLPQKHKNLFFSTSEKKYQSRLEQIESELPQLSDLDTEIELRRLLADVGDAHTALGWKIEELSSWQDGVLAEIRRRKNEN